MEEITFRPKKLKSSLYKLHLKENINTNDFELFKQNLDKLINESEIAEKNNQTEEYFKNLLKNFLEKSYYENKNFLNTMSYKGQNEADLVIHSTKDQNSKVNVIFEVKKPKNKSEMLSYDNIFKKVFFESILYFLWESVDKQNLEVKNIVITNIYEYFIFDARDIKRIFLDKSTKLENTFKKWRNNQLTDDKTDTMYQEIENYINSHKEYFDNFKFTYFDIKNLQEEDKKYLYKIFSPKHLLREILTNDSNSLNKDFYNELLHIIGLEEVEKDNKKIIQRKKNPDQGSLLENTINIIDSKDRLDEVSNISYFGANNNERIYNISLSLCIRWINRILFLKLLEGQLYKYHNFDKSYKFLDSDKINSFDKLNRLFFQILAKKTEDRNSNIQSEYFRLPYLNSSLFELSDLEKDAIDISQLENNLEIPIFKSTVLKDNRGKKLKDNISNLKYLLDFLNSYDFGSEGENELNQENKTLINASVLGLIFEKINGYKDGSFYTPGFITTYMSRESIQKAVIQKFNDKYSWNCESIDDLYNKIDKIDIKEANELVNSLKICDPAVGSGHFLVSALNEIIVLKSHLEILSDTDGKKLRGYRIENFNDELIITDEDDIFFDYKVSEYNDINPVLRKISKEKTRIQKALFFEKKHLIENCLFGVDINNNSVMICRLRLWIELLKSAFYTEESNFRELETLPNIDINIKQGNSLISRYALDVNLGQVFNKEGFRVKDYREAVSGYKESKSKEAKKKVISYLDEIKKQFKSELAQGFLNKIHSFEIEIKQMGSNLFGIDKDTKKKIAEKQKKLDEMLTQKEEIEKSEVYKDAFEWRFEFPEVLDNDGSFIGFDVVIGNPPYIDIKALENNIVKFLFENFRSSNNRVNLYSSFIENSIKFLNKNGFFSLIIPSSLLTQDSYKELRNILLSETSITNIIRLPNESFGSSAGEVKVDTIILNSQNALKINSEAEIIIYKGFNRISKISSDNSDLTFFVDTNDWKNSRNYIFRINTDNLDIQIISKCKKETKKLIDCADFCLGLTPYDKYKGHTKEQIENRVFHSEIKKDNTFKKLLAGNDIKRYSVQWGGKEWISYGNWLGAQRDKKFFTEKRILIKQIIDWTDKRIWASLTEEELYNTQNAFNLIANKDFEIEYLLAIINSKLMSFFHRKEFLEEFKDRFQKILIKDAKEFPIKILNKEKQKPFIEIVEQIIEKKKQNIDTTDLESKIDQMVYKLYDLTEDEIKIIEGS